MVDPAHKILNFGAVEIEHKVTRQAKLVNQSLLPIKFSVLLMPSSKLLALQEEGVLSVYLARRVGRIREVVVRDGMEMHLQPKEECRLQVTFSPTCLIPQFTEEVCMCCTFNELLAFT